MNKKFIKVNTRSATWSKENKGAILLIVNAYRHGGMVGRQYICYYWLFSI